jgi:prophage antirepressor-like protein
MSNECETLAEEGKALARMFPPELLDDSFPEADTRPVEAEVDNKEQNPLVALFSQKNIRIAGDVATPLFCASDVAKEIGDTSQRHILSSYAPKYKITMVMYDTRGRKHSMLMLTEQGLYRYLLRSNRPTAELFQEWVYELLVQVRRRVADEARLAVKIAQEYKTLIRSLRDCTAAMQVVIERRSLRGPSPPAFGAGYLYFIAPQTDAPVSADARVPVKVGFAKRPAKRLAALQTGHQCWLEILRAVPVVHMKGAEARMHARLRARHMRGEWFVLSRAEVDRCALAASEEDDGVRSDLALEEVAAPPEAPFSGAASPGEPSPPEH